MVRFCAKQLFVMSVKGRSPRCVQVLWEEPCWRQHRANRRKDVPIVDQYVLDAHALVGDESSHEWSGLLHQWWHHALTCGGSMMFINPVRGHALQPTVCERGPQETCMTRSGLWVKATQDTGVAAGVADVQGKAVLSQHDGVRPVFRFMLSLSDALSQTRTAMNESDTPVFRSVRV